LTFRQTFNACLQWYQVTRTEYSQVQEEATFETLRRFLWAALFLVPLHGLLAWMLTGYLATEGHPELLVWAADVRFLNASAGLLMALAAGLAYMLLRGSRDKRSAMALQIAVASGYLVYGALSTGADLVANVGVGLTTYMLASVLTGVLSLMRPAISIPLFVSAYFGFQWLLSTLPIANLNRDSLNILGLSVALMAMMASIMVWRQYARVVML
jgi:diguanylate cyclase